MHRAGRSRRVEKGRGATRLHKTKVAASTTMAALALVLGASATSVGASASPHAKAHAGHTPTKHQLLAQLSALMGHPKFRAPGPALNVKRLSRSTKVVVIDNTPSVGPLEQAAAGVISAAKAIGLTPKVLNGGANNTASDDVNLLEEGVNLHPAVVLQVGIITALETAGLKYAKAHHVPVIAVDDNPPVAGAPGEGSGPYAAGTAQENDLGLGQVIAKYIGAHGPANATIGVITSDNIVPSLVIQKGFVRELHKVCPHCKVVTQNVDTAQWTTEITPTVTSLLDAHPNMQYLFPIVDGMAPWVTPALQARPHRPQVVSVNATPGAAMSALKSGLFSAEAGTSATMIGWYAFDSALRVLLHLHQQTYPQEPMTFFTTAEMKAKHLNPNSDAALFGKAYQAGFRKLWGLG